MSSACSFAAWWELSTGLNIFSDFVCIQCLLVAFTLILKLIGEQRLLGAHGGEPYLVIVVFAVLSQPMEAVLLTTGLGCAHAPDDEGRHHQRSHGGCCRKRQNTRTSALIHNIYSQVGQRANRHPNTLLTMTD